MWQQATTGAMIWEAALSHCAALSLAGYGDWHLPNRRELRSIVECDTFNPTIDTDIFPDTVSGCYWSSTTTTYANDPSSAWYIKFSLGLANWGNKSSFSGYVRAVRGGQNRVFGHLFILAPAQGSRWDIGSSVPITWETQDIPGNVKISISRQGGNDGTFETIAETTENDGTYDWTVTGSLSCNCVLKIEPLTDPSKATTQSLFTIASTTPPIATISGVPESPTNQTGAFLNVGGDAIISGVPDSPTQQTEVTLTINGPGVTHYKYKLDAYIICF